FGTACPLASDEPGFTVFQPAGSKQNVTDAIVWFPSTYCTLGFDHFGVPVAVTPLATAWLSWPPTPPPLPPPSERKGPYFGSPVLYARTYAAMNLPYTSRIGAAPALGATVAGVCPAISFAALEQAGGAGAGAGAGENKGVGVRGGR